MKSLTLDLDHELESLDHESAMQFKQAMFTMLRLVKTRQGNRPQSPFSERIAHHPAIGTWPANVDADKHIADLRDEWSR